MLTLSDASQGSPWRSPWVIIGADWTETPIGNLQKFIAGQIWLAEYPIFYFGCRFNARMTVIRLADARVWIHSPGPLDEELRAEIDAIGPVAALIAPGNFHHMHLNQARAAYPDAKVYACPGVESKLGGESIDGILSDETPDLWAGEIDQIAVQGSAIIREVAFFHRTSKTLILTDLIENFTDATLGVNWVLKFWMKWVFGMWDRPKPAPEYRMGWVSTKAARASLKAMLAWDFERIVIAHGELIVGDAKAVFCRALKRPLGRIPA